MKITSKTLHAQLVPELRRCLTNRLKSVEFQGSHMPWSRCDRESFAALYFHDLRLTQKTNAK